MDVASTNLRKGALEFCVLAMLSGQERYGADLARALEESSLIASEGTLYPLLARLRASGAVTSRWVDGEAHRPRRYYALTEVGEKDLRSFQRVWADFSAAVDRLLRSAP